MPRTWKSALALYLAGIPQRTGFVGEGRFGLVNDLRWGERSLPRMVERCATLALPKGEAPPASWPLPELVIPTAEVAAWRQRVDLAGDRRIDIALAPGAVGPAKRWPTRHFAALAAAKRAQGWQVWVFGSPGDRDAAAEIPADENLAGRTSLDQAVALLSLTDVVVSNDSGLMHIAAAIGVPTVALFGPTDPQLWAPLNPLAAVIERRKPVFTGR